MLLKEPPVTAQGEGRRPRDPRVLGRQMVALEVFLRLGLVGRQFGEDGESWLDVAVDRGMGGWYIPASSHNHGARTEARFAPLVQAAVDTFDKHIVEYAPRALRLLPPHQQLVLRATLVYGMSQQACVEAYTDHYGEQCAISLRTVQRWKTQALTALAHLLWTDQGERQVPEALR